MTLLPMNRLYDELNKVEQHRKKETPFVTFIQQQDFDWFEQEEKNLELNLVLAEARSKPIDYKMNIVTRNDLK